MNSEFWTLMNKIVEKKPQLKQFLSYPAKAGIRFIPRGSNEPPIDIPQEPASEAAAEKAINTWDELMPDHAGMLRAERTQ